MGDINQSLERLEKDGYFIAEGLITGRELKEARTALARLLEQEPTGRNAFEGFKTKHVYTVVAKTRAFDGLFTHPLVMGLAERILGANFLLSTGLGIEIWPGENAQAWHFDDSFYLVPRPRPALSLSVILALDDFTDENGATEVIPGSHRWSKDAPDVPTGVNTYFIKTPGVVDPAEANRGRDDLVKAVMPAGSGLIFYGTLIHRGGSNRSSRPRMAISPQYCCAWLRTQENHSLAVPAETVRTLSPQLQSLLGYNIHPSFMGHVGGRHPGKMLESAQRASR
jgi:ectoine hydroxylase-related dioxygenase (phytanoyl-CoA dioxygenase family)